MAALSAKDLTALIEQVSGSAAFKKEYDKCEVIAFQHSSLRDLPAHPGFQ